MTAILSVELEIPTRLAILISGGGRTLENLKREIDAGKLDAEVAGVICSRDGIGGIERCRLLDLPCHIVKRRDFADTSEFSRKVFDLVREMRAHLVCLAGFLSLLEIPEDYFGRVVNIHPALLPKYGGQGMYGERVHKAVLDSGDTESGCTVHFADDVYDHGPVILQKKVPVLPDDDVDSLAARVFEAECVAYPEAIRRLQQQTAAP